MKGRSFGVFGIRNRLRLLVFRIMFSQVKAEPGTCSPRGDCIRAAHGACLCCHPVATRLRAHIQPCDT